MIVSNKKRIKYGGFGLSFYHNERITFKDAFELKLSDEEAKKFVKKLTRHFKLNCQSIRFYGNSGSGMCTWRGDLRLSHNPSVGLVCHEIAHLAHRRHDKKLMRWIKKLCNYSKKMKYWRKENKEISTKNLGIEAKTLSDRIDEAEKIRNQLQSKYIAKEITGTQFHEGINEAYGQPLVTIAEAELILAKGMKKNDS